MVKSQIIVVKQEKYQTQCEYCGRKFLGTSDPLAQRYLDMHLRLAHLQQLKTEEKIA